MESEEEKIAEFIKLEAPQNKVKAICHWTRVCFRKGLTVALHVADKNMSEEVDRRLWTFSDMSFIPHILASEKSDPVMEPVLIYVDEEELGEAEVLFETAPVEPYKGYKQFSHIMDFAEVYDKKLKQQSRKRFKYLQDAGYKMRFIE